MTPELTEKQEAVLDATLELIGERGFHGTPMADIAKRAGVGAGTIYRYYASKEELINALYVREKTRVNAEVLGGVHAGLSVRDAIGQIFRNVIAARAASPKRWRFLDQYYNSPFIGDETKRVREQLMAEYVEIIERGVRERVIRDLPRPVLMAMIFGPIMQLAMASQMQDVTLDDALIDRTVESVWRSIGTDQT